MTRRFWILDASRFAAYASLEPLDPEGRSRKCAVSKELSGGPCRIRTCDFDLVTIALYQLS